MVNFFLYLAMNYFVNIEYKHFDSMTVTLTLLIGKVIRPQGTRKHNHVDQNETKQAVALPPGFIKLNCNNEISP